MPLETTKHRLASDRVERIAPGTFEPARHFYPRVLNAQIHPLVAYFLRMNAARLVERYCHLNPRVDSAFLAQLLAEPTQHFRWAGVDLFCTTTASGNRRLVVLETNSCPSGNKSMPLLNEEQEQAGYRLVLEASLMPLLAKRGAVEGQLAVLFDKNYTEASGYAGAMADLTGEQVLLVPWLDPTVAPEPPAHFADGLLMVRTPEGAEVPVRGAFRYLTQRPWNRLPVRTRTRVVNPSVACLAGGRNKLIAAKAYDLYNAELEGTGLQIRVPETIPGVEKQDVPRWVQHFGHRAVIKVPYSNAGQGVFPVLGPADLARFMAADYGYHHFVVQSLIGNYSWSSDERAGRYYHVGTMPDRHGHIYVADLRLMVCAGPDGFKPVAVYGRRAAQPLPRALGHHDSAWKMLGTNLSVKQDDGSWTTETERLLIMDRKDFNTIGVGLDDLIEAYIQSVLCTRAIDSMCNMLLTGSGDLRHRLFRSMDSDPTLWSEIEQGAKGATSSSGGRARPDGE
jgi:hypothetical protein